MALAGYLRLLSVDLAQGYKLWKFPVDKVWHIRRNLYTIYPAILLWLTECNKGL